MLTKNSVLADIAVAEVENNNTFATANTISLSVPIVGKLGSSSDLDFFSFTTSTTDTLAVIFDVPTNSVYSNYFKLGLYDAAGTLLSQFVTGTDKTYTVHAPAAGAYYIGVTTAGGYYSGGTYSLTVTNNESLTPHAAADTAAPTVIRFSPADEASAVALDSNITLSFNEPVQRGTGTINLMTAAGVLVESFDAATSTHLSLTGSTLTLDPSVNLNSSTTYKVEFGAATVHDLAGNAYAGTTSYNFTTARPVPADDFAASIRTSGRLVVDSSVTGQIETTGDQDWFAVQLTAGQVYLFHLNTAATSGLTDPYLKLYDSSGNFITYNDDGPGSSNSVMSFDAISSGTYYLETRAHGGAVGAYTLSAETTPAPATGSGFSATINYSGDPSYEPYFVQAAQRWSEIIIGDLPDVNCDRGVIDDLLIDASIKSIDGTGGILGQAGYTAIRSGNDGLPCVGLMQFDSADVASMVADGTFERVVLHEMGHVLGLTSYLWQLRGLASVTSYTGANAVAAYDSLQPGVQTTVALEAAGGLGTRGSHWSETVFDTELMTGYAEASPPMPLSIVTVGALQDLGYQVNYAAADAYYL